MDALISFFSNEINIQDWIALVALNVTVIGLTSLAEKRVVIGIDYGKYLIDNYKLLNIIRIYYLLVGVAVINATSLVVMLHSFPIWIECVMYILLILSSWFVLYYLFAYVLRVHPAVKEEIYRDQILGMYVQADKVCNFEGDRIVHMQNGDRTKKKISSNVLSYFNNYNEDTIHSFAELFGPKSIVYARDKKNMKVWAQLGYGDPHDYHVDGSSNLNHISWEFFQMFRYSEIQDKWIQEILNLFNGEYAESYPRLRLYNVARSMGQINRVGFADGLWKYKFLDYLMPYILKALDSINDDTPEDRVKTELYLHQQLAIYMNRVMESMPTVTFEESVDKALQTLLSVESFNGAVSISDRIKCYKENGSSSIFRHKIEACEKKYEEQMKRIKVVVLDFGNVLVKWSPRYLFDSIIADENKKNIFYNDVLTDDWMYKVDAAESLTDLVTQRIRLFPKYEKELHIFNQEWEKTIGGEMDGMLQLVKDLKKKKFRVLGLSNWCKETFERVRPQYAVLQEIDDYIISGGLPKDILPKPSPTIFKRFICQFNLNPSECLFIDDKEANTHTARELGMSAILFRNSFQLRKLLIDDI